MHDHDTEIEVLSARLDNPDIVVYQYTDEKRNEFYDVISDADAILTGFTKIDDEAMDHASQLKVISMNATGFDNVDLDAAKKRNVGVCAVGEYCTEDVAEFTIAQILSLVKNNKYYINDIEQNHQWRYDYAPIHKRVQEMTLGIFGIGKIGTCVAKKAKSLGMNVVAYDPYTKKLQENKNIGVKVMDSVDDILQKSDIITNHMNLNKTNYRFFDQKIFEGMKQRPYFINMGRGASVVEDDLLQALNNKKISGAALDVLDCEQPDLINNPLVGRKNVIITPHAAFYTKTSLLNLQKISCQNIVHFLLNEKDRVFKLVN